MKKRIMVTVITATALNVAAQNVADFEGVLNEAETYWNGADGDTVYQSGGAQFGVYYNTSWDYWASGFAISNVTDTVATGLDNQYGNVIGSGYAGSSSYAIGTTGSSTYALIDSGLFVSGIYVTNTAYAYGSMKEGDAFAKQFGGQSGDDEDWFLLTIRGYANGTSIDSVAFYLADYRFSDNSKDYIVDQWTWVDLSPVELADSLTFELSSSDVGDWGMNTPAFFAIDNLIASPKGEFAPSASEYGTTAIHMDSSVFVGWVNQVEVQRGWVQISDTTQGKVDAGVVENGTGKPDGSVISLGDGGQAIVQFAHPIYNGAGADFAIFENSFSDEFLELALVEVSSNGVDYAAFPAISLTDTIEQVDAFGQINPTMIHNLAGKYRAQYGTPFDLDEITENTAVDLDSITHIRLTDVVGDVAQGYGYRDSQGNLINDPFPTPFPSSGFDLDAVGVIHWSVPASVDEDEVAPKWQWSNGDLHFAQLLEEYRVYNLSGQQVRVGRATMEVQLNGLTNGVYIVQIQVEGAAMGLKIHHQE